MTEARRERIASEVDAVKRIEDGMTVAFGEPAPMAMIRQVIRQGTRDLTVIADEFDLSTITTCATVTAVQLQMTAARVNQGPQTVHLHALQRDWGEGATVAAGSTITGNVADGELGVARGRQRNIKGWKRPVKTS